MTASVRPALPVRTTGLRSWPRRRRCCFCSGLSVGMALSLITRYMNSMARQCSIPPSQAYRSFFGVFVEYLYARRRLRRMMADEAFPRRWRRRLGGSRVGLFGGRMANKDPFLSVKLELTLLVVLLVVAVW